MSKSWQTKLIHTDAKVPSGYRSLAVPVYRGSTTVFPSAAAVNDHWDQPRHGYTYGLFGTPTSLELAARICELESGEHTILAPGGQAAISLIDFAMLQAGDHVLVPATIYHPNRSLTTHLLSRFGVTSTFYDRWNRRAYSAQHPAHLDGKPRLHHHGGAGRARHCRRRP